jgi:plastocyanin
MPNQHAQERRSIRGGRPGLTLGKERSLMTTTGHERSAIRAMHAGPGCTSWISTIWAVKAGKRWARRAATAMFLLGTGIALRRLRLMLVLLALAAPIVLAGCGGEGGNGEAAAAPVSGVTEVAATDNRFTPAAIHVPAGTTVTWRFQDRFVPHDVKGDGFASGEPQRSGSFAHTFDRPGTYPYRCTLHAGMDGRVVVTVS